MAGVMVSAATGVMNSLLQKLSTLLLDEDKLQKGVKGEITFLKEELSSMNAFLERLAEKEELDPQTREWRNQVREMAYDIEDFVDRYMLRLQHEYRNSTGIKEFFRNVLEKVKNLGACHGIAKQIQKLKTQIIEAGQRRKRYKLDTLAFSGDTNVVSLDPRLPALYVEAASLVGIDGPRNELTKLVDDGKKQLKVVSVVGFGGLGKTTLANQVYQKIGHQFDCQAFVSVSQKPNVRKIFRSILSKIKTEKDPSIESRDEEWLINTLRDSLKDKSYLIVIDDTWKTEHWNIIKCGLPDNNHGSRIILTTRIAAVAKFCRSSPDDVYELRKLSEADSKTLFFRRIFGSEGNCPPHLEGVSDDIIRKCGGLPLAIVTMASLLTTKSEARAEWISVRKSIGLGLEKHPDVSNMKKILSLSYNDLPCHLKTCLLYLSIYPEDYEIWMVDLVRMWMAEGFITVDGGRSLQEVGASHFNELINRSMILPVNINYDGQAAGCRVHDMILDLVVSKAAEENFVTCIDDHEHKFASQDKVRRLSLHYLGHEDMTVPSTGTAHVRSLVVFGSREAMPSILDFPAIRVLSIHRRYTGLGNSLENVGKLIQLRYLKIDAFEFERLPEEIGQLHVLETLDLLNTGIKVLPASIVELRQLKYLCVPYVKLRVAIGKMQALEELSRIWVDESTPIISVKELGSLTKLRTLDLWWSMCGSLDIDDMTTYQETLVSCISKLGKSSLRSLRINQHKSCESFDFLFDSWSEPPHLLDKLALYNVLVSKIPEWIAYQANLTVLEIGMSQLRQETIDILGDLPVLTYLSLRAEDAEESIVIGSNGFRRLMVLHMGCLACSVATTLLEAGAMPELRALDLWVRLAAEAQPAATVGATDLGIRHLLALRELGVHIHGAGAEEGKALEAAIVNAAHLLPNRPTPKISINKPVMFWTFW